MKLTHILLMLVVALVVAQGVAARRRRPRRRRLSWWQRRRRRIEDEREARRRRRNQREAAVRRQREQREREERARREREERERIAREEARKNKEAEKQAEKKAERQAEKKAEEKQAEKKAEKKAEEPAKKAEEPAKKAENPICETGAAEACAKDPRGHRLGSRQKADCKRVFNDFCTEGTKKIQRFHKNICAEKDSRDRWDTGANGKFPSGWKRPCSSYCGGVTNRWGVCRKVCYEQLTKVCEQPIKEAEKQAEKQAEEKKAENKKAEKKAEEKKAEKKAEEQDENKEIEKTLKNCVPRAKRDCGKEAAAACAKDPRGRRLGSRQKADCERVYLDFCTEGAAKASRFHKGRNGENICAEKDSRNRWDTGANGNFPSGWKRPCSSYCGGVTNKWGVCRKVCYAQLKRVCSQECKVAEKKKIVEEEEEKEIKKLVVKENKEKPKRKIKEVIIIKEGEKKVVKFDKKKVVTKVIKKGEEKKEVEIIKKDGKLKKPIRVIAKECVGQKKKLKIVKELLEKLVKIGGKKAEKAKKIAKEVLKEEKKIEEEKKVEKKIEKEEEKKPEEKKPEEKKPEEKKPEEKKPEEKKPEEKKPVVEEKKECPSVLSKRVEVRPTKPLGNERNECAYLSEVFGVQLEPAGKVDGFPGRSGGASAAGTPASMTWEHATGAHVVYVKAARGGNAFYYEGGARSGAALDSPKDSISHVTFCVRPNTPVCE